MNMDSAIHDQETIVMSLQGRIRKLVVSGKDLGSLSEDLKLALESLVLLQQLKALKDKQ